jgi:GAF domain-containing protein
MSALDGDVAMMDDRFQDLPLLAPEKLAQAITDPADWLTDVRVLWWVEQIGENRPSGGGGRSQAMTVCLKPSASSRASLRSLWWQHLIPDRASAGFQIPVLKLSHRKPVMNNVNELHEALARVVFADRELSEVLTEITGIARRAMPSVEAASVTLIREDKPFTAAYDGQMAMDADELQYERGYGPCVDAGRAGQMFLVDDMRTEQRWPDYAQNVLACGVLSSLSVPLPFQGVTIGALDTYASQPKVFDDTDVELAQEVAAWIAVAVGNAEAAARTSDDLTQLRTVMTSRACIELAKGILMERHKITEDEAFTMLAHASQRTNTKLRDVAAELVRTGTLPNRH